MIGRHSRYASAALYAAAYTLIETAKPNDVNPQAWLTDILNRISDHQINRVDELMPWKFTPCGNPPPEA